MLVHSTATYYNLFTKVYVPKTPYIKLKPGVEPSDNQILNSRTGSSQDETNLERSIRRTRSKIRDICMVNDFELFTTFTFKSHKDSDHARIQTLTDWVKNQKKRTGKFDYLVIAERHKSGKLQIPSTDKADIVQKLQNHKIPG